MQRPEIACLLSALAAHGLVLSLSIVAPDSQLVRALADRQREPPQEIEIEIAADDPRLAPAADERVAGAYATRPLSPAPRVAGARPLDPRLGEPLLAPEGPEGESPEGGSDWALPPAGEAYGDAPPPGPGIPGLGGMPLWAHGIGSDMGGPAPAPTTIAPREIDRQAATKVLKAAQKARDKELGLDLPAGGTVAAAAAAGVRASGLPGSCQGVIAVTLGPDGRLKSAQVVRGNGGSGADWASVAAFVRSSVAGKVFAMPGAFSKGAIITVSISSSMRRPSGTKVGPDAPSTSISTEGSFDLTDIGADASRVVNTSFSTSPLE